jgi:hypothetical protein
MGKGENFLKEAFPLSPYPYPLSRTFKTKNNYSKISK